MKEETLSLCVVIGIGFAISIGMAKLIRYAADKEVKNAEKISKNSCPLCSRHANH